MSTNTSGLSYAPPLYYFNNITYDPEFFANANGGITQSYADATYLKRIGIALSTATLTSFAGPVQCNGGLFISGGLTITGGLSLDTLTISGLATFNGPSTFNVPPTMSGVNISSNTIPALSIADNSLTQTQVSIGLQFVNLGVQNFSGSKTFNSPPTMSGANISSNTIPALSIVNNSLTQTQVSAGLQFIDSGVQNFSGSKTFNGSLTNQTVINISSTVPFYTGSIGFIPACTVNYLNLTTSNFDSMMYIGQPIGNGINQPYGFTMCDYNSSLTGIRISGTGASGNCNINLNGTVVVDQLLTCNDGLFVNLGDITTPNNAVIGTMFCDQFNNYDQLTGTDITFNPNNFVQCVVNAGNSSVLPTAGIGYGGLKIGWNCSNSIGETDFINLANYTNTGGFNYYTMNASSLPYLIATLRFSGLTLNGNLTNNSIVNSSGTQPYFIQNNTMTLPTTTSTASGMGIGWNALSGTGECDLINYGQAGAGGGFNFSTITSTQTNRNLALLSTLANGGFTINPDCGQLRIQDQLAGAYSLNLLHSGALSVISSKGINTTLFAQCGNGSGVSTNVLQASTTAISPLVNLSPSSTTTFNASHPTTTLPLPTLSNQYATVGYVSSVNNPNILPLNNTFTGTNLFRNTTGGIQTSLTSTVINNYFGCGAGNAQNVVIGGNSLSTVNAANNNNIAICPPSNASLQNNIGNNNIVIGNLSGNAQTAANRNIYIGATCGSAVTGSSNICVGGSAGNGITTGSNNIAIGEGAWTGANTFSNCTVIGAGAPAPTSSNSIILGRTADTVFVQGASQLTNTLLIGTTVVSNNLQVNGNIILPLTISSAGVNITYTSIPPYIIFLPIAGMSFTLPAPSAANTGQEFVIRKYGAGGGQTIIFNCVGSLAVWVPANSGPTGNTTLAVSTTWQFRFVSTGVLFLQIA